MEVFKHRRDNSRVDALAVQRIEILVRRQVDPHSAAMTLEVFVDRVRNRAAPEFI